MDTFALPGIMLIVLSAALVCLVAVGRDDDEPIAVEIVVAALAVSIGFWLIFGR